MRIHTDTLEVIELRRAATLAGVRFSRLDTHGSRSRDHAYNVILTGSSFRQQNGGTDKAATWDEWGIFLATLFGVDARMVTTYYESADHFHWATGDRYRTLTLDGQHKNHKWDWCGQVATGAYMVHACKGCDAIRRFMTRGTFDSLALV